AASLKSPDAWFGKFQRIARWITEIDRTSTLRPFEIRLDSDTSCLQPGLPPVDFLSAGGKAEMAIANGAVRRNRQPGIGRWRNPGGLGIEEQQHTLPAAKEYMPPVHLRDALKAHHFAVELFRGVEIGDIEGG